MEDSLGWKVGDKFRLPNNELFTIVYTIDSFGPMEDYTETRYWFFDRGSRFHTTPRNMKKVTPLEELL